ncbi:MAG: AAA family ATPase [Paracholeplasma sp.]|nr:AAA family ATPase [Paracholeplasma sp.]MDY3195865.1 AAA family ATPase [Paracholeplasma sp.]
MLKRKIYDDLIKWKDSLDKKAILLKGSRHVGKTYIVNYFAKENYTNLIHLDFENNPKLRSIFDGELDLGTLTKQISLKLQTEKMVPNKTLIFLDEVHLCPRARMAVTNLTAQDKYDVIMATSAYGMNIDNFPLELNPNEQLMNLYGLDFEEFLWANSINLNVIEQIKTHFIAETSVPSVLHDAVMELLKEYTVIGGMPKVVDVFTTKHNFKSALKIQKEILKDYMRQMQMYLSKVESRKTSLCFNSIPKQLEKTNKKFMYGVVEELSNARKYEKSILNLHDSDLIEISFNLTEPKWPFRNQVKYDVFKVYLKDIGLLTSMYGAEAQQSIMDGDFSYKEFAILESLVADILIKGNHKLYYFSKNATLDVEFVLKLFNRVTAISVNHADNTKAKALDSVYENYGVKSAIKLSMTNKFEIDIFVKMPIYMAMFLQ